MKRIGSASNRARQAAEQKWYRYRPRSTVPPGGFPGSTSMPQTGSRVGVVVVAGAVMGLGGGASVGAAAAPIGSRPRVARLRHEAGHHAQDVVQVEGLREPALRLDLLGPELG